jgi:pyruvate-ferredoxin/flavodoxin oxidoreductase
MQTCFFALNGILPQTYGKRGEAVVQRNFQAVDETLNHLYEVRISAAGEVLQVAEQGTGTATPVMASETRHGAPIALPMVTARPPVPAEAPAFVRNVLGPMIAGEGDELPVSALPVDGTYPSGTARWEKRNIAQEMPVWDPMICIQCGKCTMVCPHAVIREKVYDPSALQGAPETFVSTEAHFKELPGARYTLQVSPEDCTGCVLCVEACPVKDKRQIGRKAINMQPQPPLREREKANWEFSLTVPEIDRTALNLAIIKDTQLL